MEPTHLPPNSRASRNDPGKPRVEKIVSGEARTRKRSFRRQITETFLGGDLKSAVRTMIMDIAIPETRDMVYSVFTGGLERLFFGEGRRRGSTQPQSGPMGYMQYNRFSPGSGILSSSARTMNRSARANHDFDQIILSSRTDAQAVIDQLFEVVSQYGEATVADLYQLVDLPTNHTDNKWGWTNLRGAGVSRDGDNFLLDLPKPESLA